jgi:hypothetical protein
LALASPKSRGPALWRGEARARSIVRLAPFAFPRTNDYFFNGNGNTNATYVVDQKHYFSVPDAFHTNNHCPGH